MTATPTSYPEVVAAYWATNDLHERAAILAAHATTLGAHATATQRGDLDFQIFTAAVHASHDAERTRAAHPDGCAEVEAALALITAVIDAARA